MNLACSNSKLIGFELCYQLQNLLSSKTNQALFYVVRLNFLIVNINLLSTRLKRKKRY